MLVYTGTYNTRLKNQSCFAPGDMASLTLCRVTLKTAQGYGQFCIHIYLYINRSRDVYFIFKSVFLGPLDQSVSFWDFLGLFGSIFGGRKEVCCWLGKKKGSALVRKAGRDCIYYECRKELCIV